MTQNDQSIKDGAYLMYVKDGVTYPVAMTEEEHNLLQLFVANAYKPLKVSMSRPQGKAHNPFAKEQSE